MKVCKMRGMLVPMLVLGFLMGGVVHSAQGQSTLDRPRDPVVLAGSALEDLQGLPINAIVGFRYDGGWQQIPIQIDERKFADFGVVYNDDPIGLGTMAYADAATYLGADTDPDFDADDELVFMAADAGGQAPSGTPFPDGVLMSGPGLEVKIEDPLDLGLGYVYLFRSAGDLEPGADEKYVTYNFVLEGDKTYIPDYNLHFGYNTENSEVLSPFYRTRFLDRWVRDELNIYAGGANGAEILDRHKSMFAPGDCGRTEDIFSHGEGAFFTNKDGAIRGIRSYMGAMSGVFLQREHFFYRQRHDITTFVRLHQVYSLADLYDYSPDATGMIYYNDLNEDGVLVDGVPDSVTPGPIEWEMVTGAQGTAVISHAIETDIDPFTYTSYYSDNVEPTVQQCMGDLYDTDPYEYATSGLWIDQGVPNTDPHLGPANKLEIYRVVYYEAPGQTVAMAELRDLQARIPMDVWVFVFGEGPSDVEPPTPNPMTWDVHPYATGHSSIAMTATTATDPSGVEYFFDCTAGGGHDSGWQDSPSYEDTGLQPDTSYTYRVTARDKSSNQNETGPSSEASATTDQEPGLSCHVGSIDLTATYVPMGPSQGYVAIATIVIHDQNCDPLPGVTVEITWSGCVSGNDSKVTDDNGQVIFFSPPSQTGGTFTCCVNDLIKTGYLYKPEDNHETCDSITHP